MNIFAPSAEETWKQPHTCSLNAHIAFWSFIASKFAQNELKPEAWPNTYHNFQSWYKNLVGKTAKDRRKTIFTLTNLVCWELWKERNRRIFEKKRVANMRYDHKNIRGDRHLENRRCAHSSCSSGRRDTFRPWLSGQLVFFRNPPF
jgi:hypothetical protein